MEPLRSGTDVYLYFGNLGWKEEQYKNERFLGLALRPRHARELAHDVHHPLPFSSDSVPKIQAQDVFEHLQYDRIPSILDEVYRVLAPGGVFRLSVPDYRSPLLMKRTVYDHCGRPIADLRMGGRVEYSKQTKSTKVEFAEDGSAHIWFPTYERVLELVVRSTVRMCSRIEFYHYWRSETEYVCRDFPLDEMHVKRAPPYDTRADGKPLSIIVDFVK